MRFPLFQGVWNSPPKKTTDQNFRWVSGVSVSSIPAATTFKAISCCCFLSTLTVPNSPTSGMAVWPLKFWAPLPRAPDFSAAGMWLQLCSALVITLVGEFGTQIGVFVYADRVTSVPSVSFTKKLPQLETCVFYIVFTCFSTLGSMLTIIFVLTFNKHQSYASTILVSRCGLTSCLSERVNIHYVRFSIQ